MAKSLLPLGWVISISASFITRVPEIQKLVSDLLHEVATWKESDDMRRLLLELDRVNRVLRDELAVIILRRVVPERCKYCPI